MISIYSFNNRKFRLKVKCYGWDFVVFYAFYYFHSFGIVLFNIITRTNGFGGNPSAAIVELIKSRGQKPNLRKVDEIDLALKQRKNEIYLEIFKDLKMWMEKCYHFNTEKRPVMRQSIA